ncbi:hypothetical protein NSPZN2_30676 [Nitrospira defluvii]|uniref:Uncharacterized protein n=1 Tax=Nitrospira defluvii TaxID=330214 RepID=A0ABN7LP31_9BACT|nr:hypothetical protein NSPZN2_30676 [Nitrospira defluvii]
MKVINYYLSGKQVVNRGGAARRPTSEAATTVMLRACEIRGVLLQPDRESVAEGDN